MESYRQTTERNLHPRGTVIRYPSKIGGIDLISPKLFELESWNFGWYIVYPLGTGTTIFAHILAAVIFSIFSEILICMIVLEKSQCFSA